MLLNPDLVEKSERKRLRGICGFVFLHVEFKVFSVMVLYDVLDQLEVVLV